MAKRYDYKVEYEMAHRAGTEWRKVVDQFDTLDRASEAAQWLKDDDRRRFRNVVIYRRPRPDWEVIG